MTCDKNSWCILTAKQFYTTQPAWLKASNAISSFSLPLPVSAQNAHTGDKLVTLFVKTNKLTFLLADRCYEHILLRTTTAKQQPQTTLSTIQQK